jgi:uncharacterized protein (DUF433 family)
MSDSQSIIHDRGRGPEIRGTRITVYDILDHYPDKGWRPEQIAALFRLSIDQVHAALEYIEEHRVELQPKYQRMLDLVKQGDPPEAVARHPESHARLMALKEKLHQQTKAQRAGNARAAG